MCRLLFTLSFAGCTHILVLPFGGWQWHPAGKGYAKEAGAARAVGRGHPAARGLTYAPPYMAYTQAWGSEWPRGTRPTSLRSAQGTNTDYKGVLSLAPKLGKKSHSGRPQKIQTPSRSTNPVKERAQRRTTEL